MGRFKNKKTGMHGTPYCPQSIQFKIEKGLSEQRGTFRDKIEFVKTIHKISGFPRHILTLIIVGIGIKTQQGLKQKHL